MSLAAEIERALHYPLADQLPPPGGAIQIAPGVKWLRMVLPFALDHINLWLLRDRLDGRDGWTVVPVQRSPTGAAKRRASSCCSAASTLMA